MKILKSLPFRLLVGVALGIVVGLLIPDITKLSASEAALPSAILQIIVTVKYILNQLISFCVPLIIIGFIAPSIVKLGSNASRMLGVALLLAYVSSLGAALFSMGAGFAIIPSLNIVSTVEGLKEVPEAIFQLDIPAIMSVMSALVFSVLIGLAATWVKAKTIANVLQEFQDIVLKIVTKVIIPILPIFIACTFCTLSYEGTITKQLPIFLIVIIIVMIGHYIWLALLYALGGAYSKTNPIEVVKHYGPAYITAVGTMSSAATLAVALRCAKKAKTLRGDMVDFGIPLFANIHLCGSVLTEVFFVMVVSKILYGALPNVGTMVLFCVLLGVFAVGAPGVPGGTVMASLGLIISVLGFDDTGTALMLTIFALQDSFGTACNVTGDGALTLMLTGYAKKHNIKEEKIDFTM
ncbi:MAG TPA: dicarboxylate/amino acid:cation symporter [Candidatus Avoscillospira avicola]|uniref:Dicarboxylate/amino acid:cation symporter n=1 Tax=Candidatus Avoscillospira avicola TaxID=2840706 RepID=A0A9D1DHY6_9FIRM|nr:dicarboxylate/amino acid:cation symporter [Candidatus Avoscillospira avicola]